MQLHNDSIPLAPGQFQLRAALGAMTVCCVVLAIVRLLPEPPRFSPAAILIGLLFLGLITSLVYFVVRNIDDGGPLLAGMIGTLFGGPAFGVMVGAYAGEGFEVASFMLLAMFFGIFWAGVFLLSGLLAALLWGMIRGRTDVWSGVICGATTGFCTLLPFVFDGVSRSHIYICLFPALVGGAYGGFASAVQIHHARFRQGRRRAMMPARIDLSEVPLRELVTPTPSEHSPSPSVFP